MSRIGCRPIELLKGVTIKIAADNNVEVKGPKGSLFQWVDPAITVGQEGEMLLLNRTSDQKKDKALHGLYRMLLYNMVEGVTKGFKKSLEIVGLGYKATMEKNVLELSLGKSHTTYMKMPPEVMVEVENKKGKNPRVFVHISGSDKQLVGQVAAKIRGEKPPEFYISKRENTQKGIRYTDELLIGKSKKDGK